MTEPTQDTPTPDVAPPSFNELAGLEGDTPSFVITKPVNPSQLTEALLAVPHVTGVVLQLAPDLDSPFDASDSSPVTVYVTGGTKHRIQTVIHHHVADAQFGMSDGEKADQAALAKVQDPTATLTNDDLAAAIRVMLNPTTVSLDPVTA